MMTISCGKNEVKATEEDLSVAHRLSGKEWHMLSTEDTALAIHHEHVLGLLGPAVRKLPARGHGECLVGQITIPADA